jgi:putative hydrolase of the HAD superfamily
MIYAGDTMTLNHTTDNPSIRNVIFDIGGVLLNWDPDTLIEPIIDSPEVRDRVKREMFGHDDWLALDRGTMTPCRAIRRFAKRTDLPDRKVKELFLAARDSLKPIPGSMEFLAELHARGVPLYCLSNLSQDFYLYLRLVYKFWNNFNGWVMSFETGTIKPDPAIYRHLLDKFNLRAGETVFIDDRETNVAGAESVGMKAFRFTTIEDCRSRIDEMLRVR